MLKIWMYEYQNTTSDTSSDPIQISINFSPSFFFSPSTTTDKAHYSLRTVLLFTLRGNIKFF